MDNEVALEVRFSLIALSGYDNFFRISKLLCLATLLFAAATANASPTGVRRGAGLPVSLSLRNTGIATSRPVNNILKPASAKLASLGRELSQPPQSFAGSLNYQSNSVRPLPAIPATVLMLLSGFLCVSLYRDRKIWLMGLMGILWAGQAGIQTIPRLARHFDQNRTKKQIYAKQTQSICLKDYKISPSDIKRTKYIGLLHYLAGLPKTKSRSNLLHTSPQAVIRNQDNPVPLFVCPACTAEQFTCFSPAFIFNNLSRGPPVLS
jgi:hypothetical protein